jgi:hypothetical protein
MLCRATAVAELEREREELLALASASVGRKEIRAERLLQRLPEIYAERCKAIEIGVKALPDQDSLRGARDAAPGRGDVRRDRRDCVCGAGGGGV